MKTVLTKFLAISSIGLLMLASCKKEGTKVVATTGTGGAVQASSTTVVLSKAHLADTAITFTLTNASYGFQAAATNVLQIDAASDNFANPKEYTIAAGLHKQSFTVPDFNSLLLALNLPTGTASQVQVRLKSTLSTTSVPVYSAPITLSATPFALIAYVWVAGTYQGGTQWNPPTADSLVSPTGNGVYSGYVYFDAGGNFKVTSNPDWNHTNYGDAGGGTISSSGGNLNSPGAGLYLVTVDLNANTISYAPYVHTWSLIGDADVDWNTDFQMPFNKNDNSFEVTTNLKASGGFKFRADGQWTLSLGNEAPVTGRLTSTNGANLGVAADGTYVVKLTFGNPLMAPSYTAVKQ